jgi:rhamnosyltransferase
MKTQHPKIAVLLAAYNGKKWIEEQINSILNQENVAVTIYVSVDLSTDNTYELVKELSSTFEQIKVLPYGERYGCAAANFFRLIREVKFEDFDFVALSDQDDIWFEWKLYRGVSQLKDLDCVGYSSNVTAFWPDGIERLLKKSYAQCKYDHFFESPGPGCTFLFQADVLTGFQLAFKQLSNSAKEVSTNHDWYLYAYIRQQGLKWTIDDCSTMKYRQHSSNEMGVNTGIKNYISRLKMVKSKWYRKQVMNVVVSFAPEMERKLSDRIFLIFNFMELRRRPRDRVALLFMLMLGIY